MIAQRNTERLAPDAAGLNRAAKLLRDGGLVAFPTETVYGLGADATRAEAVAGIYAAKERPQFNPLIAHVTGADAALEQGVFDAAAQALAAAFWPGPLTLVVQVGRAARLAISPAPGSTAWPCACPLTRSRKISCSASVGPWPHPPPTARGA